MEILGYALALFVGMALGLIGGGGSVLTVPIMVYILHIEPVLATGYSLFIVGSSAFVGALRNYQRKLVSLKTAVLFAIPSMAAVYITRKFTIPAIPDPIPLSENFSISKSIAIMTLFAIVMVVAALLMLRKKEDEEEDNDGEESKTAISYNYSMIAVQGLGIGMLAGLVGAGGGFLIVPALVLLAKLPMKLAVGTSLTVISINSLFGVIGDLQSGKNFDWQFLLIFSGLSIVGILIGSSLSQSIPGHKLKKGFGYFILCMAVFIICKEFLF